MFALRSAVSSHSLSLLRSSSVAAPALSDATTRVAVAATSYVAPFAASSTEQQTRNYGRKCPTVRKYEAKKKRTAAAAAKAASAVATNNNAMSTLASVVDATSTGDDGPSMEVAKAMPINFKDMDNVSLLTLSALKVEEARAEMLRRHIMTVDNVPYSDACKIFDSIAAENRKGMLMHTIPYKLGVSMAMGGAIFSIPLCFHLPSVHWFNEHYVTTDVPEPQDLETWLEVGSWAWNWMEPPLGQISFFLLCLQFARSQIANLGVRPYTAKIKAMRAQKIVKKYPQYDATLLANYSKSVNFY